MIDDEIRALRADAAACEFQGYAFEVAKLADEALRRGESLRLQREAFKEVGPVLEQARGYIARLEEALHEIYTLVDRQTEDEGLWFITKTTSEAYLQQALRRLHKVIEQARAALEGKP